jgi:hypothetical protein
MIVAQVRRDCYFIYYVLVLLAVNVLLCIYLIFFFSKKNIAIVVSHYLRMTGRINESDYVLSHVYHHQTGELAYVNCERCTHAALNNQGSLESSCAHSVLLKEAEEFILNPVRDISPMEEFSDAFWSWMSHQAALPCRVIKLKQRGTTGTYLVVVDDCSLDHRNGRFGLCTLIKTNAETRIRCTNAACIASRRLLKHKVECSHIRILIESSDDLTEQVQCDGEKN